MEISDLMEKDMRRWLIALVAIFAAQLSIPVRSEDGPQASALERAREALAERKASEAIALVDPIIAKAEARDAKDADAMCPGVAAAVLGAFLAKQNSNVVVSVEDDWCEAMLLKGYALNELKQPENASAILGKLVGHDSNNPNYVAEYAYSLQASGKLDDSKMAYERLKVASSKLSDKVARRHWKAVALRGVGYIHSERREWEQAVKAYEQSLKEEPGNKIALNELDYIAESRSQ